MSKLKLKELGLTILHQLRCGSWWLTGSFDPALPLGLRGELAAARFLRRKGYTILEHSASDRLGEVDLVALAPRERGQSKRSRRLVFIEVKTRSDSTSDHPADRVDQQKQQRLTRSALRYLKEHRLLDHPARFDVIAVWWPAGGLRPSRIEHFENAFEPTGVSSFFS